jgi:hypothetical protein
MGIIDSDLLLIVFIFDGGLPLLRVGFWDEATLILDRGSIKN